MSQYVPRIGRDGTQWPKPPGTWKKGQDISHLATLAAKMNVADDRMDTDLLNSVPTPWARLLLFENALYNPEHPSHHDILDQWRGLLGLIALAAPLGIILTPGSQETTVDLRELQPHNRIAKTFLDLRPHYRVSDNDVEKEKWNQFHLIAVEGSVLGATSPRTLVFTGISHQCPPSIPFRSSRGRLSDPVLYYRKFGDARYLSLLKHWLGTLISGLTNNPEVINLLGYFPSPPGVQPDARHPKLIALLQSWLNEMASQPAARNIGQLRQLFSLLPYDSIKGLPVTQPDADYESDLLLKSEREGKTIIGFHPALKSFLLNPQGDPVQNEALKICDGRWTKGNEGLPNPLYFLPRNWGCINDPVEAFFEDRLIEVALPENPTGVYALNLNQKNFLYPFKREILNYLSPEEVAQNTTISVEADSGYTVRLRIPLVNDRSIDAVRYYSVAKDEVVWDAVTADLASWPEFSSNEWHHYFYFKRRTAGRVEDEIDFTPINGIPSRAKEKYEWYASDVPVEAFIGTNRGKHGLLLVKYEKLGRIEYHWKVSVDFGSTHTRAFRLLVNPPSGPNEPYSTAPGASIQPIKFTTHARPLTASSDDAVLRSNFFPLSGTLDPESREELKTLLMQPVSDNGQLRDWLPREGFIYMHWILEGYDPDRLKYDIKWEGGNNQNALSAYLKCLLIMIQAEAVKEGARVISVSRSYPSAFSRPLQAEHDREWTNLGNYLGLLVEQFALWEAVATCRYLEYEENARTTSNTISLDVGGSTTDIAIWAGKRDAAQKQKVISMEIQESVKMAAGVISQYLNSQGARPFLAWFQQRVKENNVDKFSFNTSTQRRLNPGLMFNNLLSFFELGGETRQREFSSLLGQLQAPNPATDNSAKQEGVQGARMFMSHLIFLFGGLIYYVGLLVRKLNLAERGQNHYNIYFCGKGGKLIQWIPGYEEFVKKMFEAGLYGDGSKGKQDISITLNISKRPKQEVGRGLLADSSLAANPKEEGFGLLDILAPSVTVGESGYHGLQWDGSLNGESLQNLQQHPMPAFQSLKELHNFIRAIKPAFEKKGQPPTLDFSALNESEYMQQLEQRFFSQRPGQGGPGELIEPLFITELKVLLEVLTDNPKLFS